MPDIQRRIALQPAAVEDWSALGTEALRQGRDEALSWLGRAAALDPRSGEVRSNLGEALRRSGATTAAIAQLSLAASLAPNLADAHGNRGLAELALDRIEEAAAALRRAIALDPGSFTWLKTLADVGGEALDLDGAKRWIGRALAIEPASAEAHFNLAWILLAAGDYASGLREYEWRLFLAETPPALRVPGKPWNGEPLEGGAIRLLAEQGYGDTLQFVRFAALVAERGGVVVAECRAELAGLVATVPGVARTVRPGENSPECAWHAAMTSLPAIFGTTLASLPGPVPYVTAPAEWVAAWQRRLEPMAGLKVGLCWRGNPRQASDARRSPGLAEVAPLLAVGDTSFIGLVKQPGKGEHVADLALDVAPELGDFTESAALFANLDLVITSDTAVAHLAGALGVPVWILLCHAPDWRWMLGRDDSLWYPTARLYRQERRGEWGPVVGRAAADLRALAAKRGDRTGSRR